MWILHNPSAKHWLDFAISPMCNAYNVVEKTSILVPSRGFCKTKTHLKKCTKLN